MNLKDMTPSKIDAELEKAYIAKNRAVATISHFQREMDRRPTCPLSPREEERLHLADDDLAMAVTHIREINREFIRRGGWERAFLVTNGNGHAHKSMHCETCYSTTQFAWMTELSGKTEAEIIEAIGDKACTICYPDAPVAKLTTAERKSRARAEVEARKAEKAEVKRQKELAKVPRAHAAALKVDELIEAFGDDDHKAYHTVGVEAPFKTGYDNAYYVYSDIIRKRKH